VDEHGDEVFNPFIMSGRLSMQFMTDGFAKTEENNLRYYVINQDQMRTTSYQTFMQANVNGDVERIGQKTILPSTFKGGPRDMQQKYQDAMSIVRHHGKPDLFITLTCNPAWPDITKLCSGVTKAADRIDIVARVFNYKLKELMDDITKHHVFGKPDGWLYVVEFQKRGLPHAHILVILEPDAKPRSCEDYSKFVSCEIPDKEVNPELHRVVTTSMIHGPCGVHNPNSPCMKDGQCTKNFPKQFQEQTSNDQEGYPAYQRRSKEQGGHTFIKKVNGVDMEIDSSWVVPYNPTLLVKYGAHVNTEICSTIKSVKYVFKYVYKGHDKANINIGDPVLLIYSNY
jgi:hypothetical protein